MADETPGARRCPFCAQALPPAAITCGYCGEWVDAPVGILHLTDQARRAPETPQAGLSTCKWAALAVFGAFWVALVAVAAAA